MFYTQIVSAMSFTVWYFCLNSKKIIKLGLRLKSTRLKVEYSNWFGQNGESNTVLNPHYQFKSRGKPQLDDLEQ